jgi:hypothetical protein
MIERRIEEASALRQFFQEQWGVLQRLMGGDPELQVERKLRETHLAERVESIVDGTDVRMRGVSRYQRRLRQSAHGLLVYIHELVQRLPSPLLLDRHSITNHNEAGALFSNIADFYRLLLSSERVKELTDGVKPDDGAFIYALLSVGCQEKRILGGRLQGDVMVRDVVQTALCFSGHRVLAPAETEQDLRKGLEHLLFDQVIAYLKVYLTGLRHGMVEGDPLHCIEEGADLKNPQKYLDALVEILSLPLRLLRLEQDQLQVDRMGILVTDEASEYARDIRLDKLGIGNHAERVVMMVKAPLSELQGCHGI